ncbi:hypothetical protein [Dactylosporangium sp. CA-139066]|uniref:hypothetical protein n=1 Tax=Dactylosporangium sp. CA-139066 TaxID=3239930 RepID=UPI003D90382E
MMPFAAQTVKDIPVRAIKLCGLTWSGDVLWFSEAVSNQIFALDPVTAEVTHRIPCPGVRTDLTTLDGRLIQVVGERRDLRVIDPATGAELDTVANPRPDNLLCGLEATSDGIWFGYEDLRQVDLRDSADLSLLASFPVRYSVAGLTVSDNYLVYADYQNAMINVVDLEDHRDVASYSVAGNPTGVTWDGSRIWYCDYTTLQLRAIEVPGIVKG